MLADLCRVTMPTVGSSAARGQRRSAAFETVNWSSPTSTARSTAASTRSCGWPTTSRVTHDVENRFVVWAERRPSSAPPSGRRVPRSADRRSCSTTCHVRRVAAVPAGRRRDRHALGDGVRGGAAPGVRQVLHDPGLRAMFFPAGTLTRSPRSLPPRASTASATPSTCGRSTSATTAARACRSRRPSTRRCSTPTPAVRSAGPTSPRRSSSTPGPATGATAGRWHPSRSRSSRPARRPRPSSPPGRGRARGPRDGSSTSAARLPGYRRSTGGASASPSPCPAPVVPAARADGLRRSRRRVRPPRGGYGPPPRGELACWPSAPWTAWSTGSRALCVNAAGSGSGCQQQGAGQTLPREHSDWESGAGRRVYPLPVRPRGHGPARPTGERPARGHRRAAPGPAGRPGHPDAGAVPGGRSRAGPAGRP